MKPCATSQLLADRETFFMNGLDHEQFAPGLWGVAVTLSVSWLRNAINDSYFYMISLRLSRRSGTNGSAHDFTCPTWDRWCLNVTFLGF